MTLPKNCINCEESLWGAFIGVKCMISNNRIACGSDVPKWCPLRKENKTAKVKPTRFDWFCPECGHKEQSFAMYKTCKCEKCETEYKLEFYDDTKEYVK